MPSNVATWRTDAEEKGPAPSPTHRPSLRTALLPSPGCGVERGRRSTVFLAHQSSPRSTRFFGFRAHGKRLTNGTAESSPTASLCREFPTPPGLAGKGHLGDDLRDWGSTNTPLALPSLSPRSLFVGVTPHDVVAELFLSRLPGLSAAVEHHPGPCEPSAGAASPRCPPEGHRASYPDTFERCSSRRCQREAGRASRPTLFPWEGRQGGTRGLEPLAALARGRGRDKNVRLVSRGPLKIPKP